MVTVCHRDSTQRAVAFRASTTSVLLHLALGVRETVSVLQAGDSHGDGDGE